MERPKIIGEALDAICDHVEKLERERNEWKANHDNQVELKRAIACRPDMAERAPMVEKLMSERNRAKSWSVLQHNRILDLEGIIRETILSNLHLADGDNCTLKLLKYAISFELPPENVQVDLPPKKGVDSTSDVIGG